MHGCDPVVTAAQAAQPGAPAVVVPWGWLPDGSAQLNGGRVLLQEMWRHQEKRFLL